MNGSSDREQNCRARAYNGNLISSIRNHRVGRFGGDGGGGGGGGSVARDGVLDVLSQL